MATPLFAFRRALLTLALLWLAPQSAGAPADSALASGHATVVGQAKVNTSALYAAHTARRPVTLERVPLAEFGDVRVDLEPFTVVNENTLLLAAGGDRPDRPIEFDPSSVATFRGAVVGMPGSSAYLALAPRHGGTGVITLADGRAFRFSPNEDAAARAGELVLDVFSTNSARAGEDALDCATPDPSIAPAARGIGTYTPYTPVDPSSPMLDLELAIDCDFEFFGMFPNEQTTLEHLAMLFGEISAIYQRDVRTRIRLVLIRIWVTDDDPYLPSNSSLLSIVSEQLNPGFPTVRKDAVSLMSGRKDLRFGGVAQLARRCDTQGREWFGQMTSVNGYQTPTLPHPAGPHLYEFNVGLICHELGHNCGSSHTHSYGFDDCASRVPARGTIMSYCHIVAGGNSNLELRFDARVARIMRDFLETNPDCIPVDQDGDTVADTDQILADPSLDTDLNGLLDAYEDRNANGVPDGLDIDAGSETDVDGNRVPDRFEPDCNANGIPDHFEISTGLSEDLTHNTLPDACETDCNADGIADVNQFNETLALDIDRNYQLDACQDCDADGVQDFEQLGTSGWVYLGDGEEIVAVNATGVGVAEIAISGYLGHAVHPDGRVVAVAGQPAQIVVVSPDLSAELHRHTLATPEFADILDVSFRGESLFITDRETGVVQVGSVDTGDAVVLFQAPVPTQDNPITSASVARDGTDDIVLTIGRPFAIVRLDSETGSVKSSIQTGLDFTASQNAVTAQGQMFVLDLDDGGAASLHEIRDATIARTLSPSHAATSSWGLRAPRRLGVTPGGRLGLTTLFDTPVLYREFDPGTLEPMYRGGFYVYRQEGTGLSGADVTLDSATDFAFAPGAPGDCNRNGIPDSCDIAEGREADTNADGVPDSCAPTRCVADTNADGSLTPADLTAWLVAYRAGDPLADSSLDGFVRFDDFSAWVVAYQNGCD